MLSVVAQPTALREYSFIMVARYSQPVLVRTQVISHTRARLGALGV